MKRRSAFTLTELILVMALMVLLAMMAYPSWEAMREGHAVTRGVDDTRMAWVTAQARASDEGRCYRFAVVPGTSNWRVAPDTEAYWGGTMEGPEETDLPPLIREDTLPKGVYFILANGEGDGQSSEETILDPATLSPSRYRTVALFLPDGTARDDARIGIRSASCEPHWVHLRAMTGVMVVLRPGEEE